MNTLLDSLPEWMRSARFRLTVLYSSILFLVAALLVGTLYMALLRSVSNEPVTRTLINVPDLGPIERISAQEFERRVNEHTLRQLKEYSFGALGILFVVSLSVGWVVSGRVLSPIDRITDVARRIQATDLSQRIALEGPDDELKRLADTFDEMLARIDQAFESQRQFVADASHELRNPLATIRANLDVVMADEKATEEDYRQTIEIARRAANRMSTLVDDLLALARLETPRPTWERVDVTSLVNEVTEEFKRVAGDRDIAIDIQVSDGLLVRGEPDSLKRAVVNLIDNAVAFSPEGSPIKVGAGLRPGWIWVAVEDRGPGIPQEHQRKVFDRLWRADKSRSRRRGGSGLGLAIVRQVAEAHGGDVKLFSSPGVGSTFVLWIPVEQRHIEGSAPDDLPLARAGVV